MKRITDQKHSRKLKSNAAESSRVWQRWAPFWASFWAPKRWPNSYVLLSHLGFIQKQRRESNYFVCHSLSLSVSLSQSHTHPSTHTHTNPHTHTHTHKHSHARTRTQLLHAVTEADALFLRLLLNHFKSI